MSSLALNPSPVKLICIGRNYGDHARELGNEVPDEPVVFLKPATALLPEGADFTFPSFTDEVHYELELVVRISVAAKDVSQHAAAQYYDAVSLGVDFTARAVQASLKAGGLPWEKAKAFDGSAAVGAFVPVGEVGDLDALTFTLDVGGEERQRGETSHMLFPVDRLVAEASRYFTLAAGDLLYTGTPAGVGPVHRGDELVGRLGGRELLRLRVS